MKARFSLGLLVAGAMVATALLFGAGTAGAAVTNVNCPGGDLQNAIDTASYDDTIVIYGTCYGNFTIDGFTVGQLTLQGGSSGATLNGRGTGSALQIIDSADVTIRNLTITNGNASEGGGLYMGSATSLTMSNSTVKGNRADFGGGIYADGSFFLDLTGVTVTRNTAAYEGGGILVYNTSLEMTASTVSLNKEVSSGISYGGGGIWLAGANVFLTNTRVTSNTSADYGGGIADYGGSIGKMDAKPFQGIVASGGLTLVNSSVDHNIAADDGGGIYNTSDYGDSPVVIQGSAVSFNNALEGNGGGIYNYGEGNQTASVLVTGSTFKGNNARNGDGGAIFNGAIISNAGTGLVTIADSGVSNARNNLNQNQAMHGGGIANEGSSDSLASLSIQSGAQITGNKASVTGGGVYSRCASLLKTGGNVLLNTPNNIVISNSCPSSM